MSAEMHLNCTGHSHSADHLHKISAFCGDSKACGKALLV